MERWGASKSLVEIVMCGLECERYEEHSYANTWVSAVSSRETARGQRCETLKTAIKWPSDFQRKCYSLRKIACWKSAEAECSERFSPGAVFAKRTGQKRGWVWLQGLEGGRGRENDLSKWRSEKGQSRLNHLIKKISNCRDSSDFAGFKIAFGMRRQ